MVRFEPPIIPNDMINGEYQNLRLGDLVDIYGTICYVDSFCKERCMYNFKSVGSERIWNTKWIVNISSIDTKIVEYLEDLE